MIFCPGGRSTNILSAESPQLSQLANTGSVTARSVPDYPRSEPPLPQPSLDFAQGEPALIVRQDISINVSSSAAEAPSVQDSPSVVTTSYATSSIAPNANATIPIVIVAPSSAAPAAEGLCTCGSTNPNNIGTPSWNGGDGDKPGPNDNFGGESGEDSNPPDSTGSEVGGLNGAPAGGLASTEGSLSVALPSSTESVSSTVSAIGSASAAAPPGPTGVTGAAPPSSGVEREAVVRAKAVLGPRRVWVPLVAALGGTAVVFALL